MWGPILEKAWAKVKGSYQSSDGGVLATGMRSLVGAPNFYYYEIEDPDEYFELIKAADERGYVMAAETGAIEGGDQVLNDCGIVM